MTDGEVGVDLGVEEKIVVVSGIPAGDSGTGRLISHLRERMGELVGDRLRLVARPERPARWQIQLWLRNRQYRYMTREVLRYAGRYAGFVWGLTLTRLKRDRQMILLHPQNLGYDLALRLLGSRRRTPLVYLLDSSFFCVSSYNHLAGGSGACLRCLELGYGQVAANGCRPFPRPDPRALRFAPALQALVKAGQVRVAVQNQRQAGLAQRHFELPELPPATGLWTQDWDGVLGAEAMPPVPSFPGGYAWDVVFHGHSLDAKGARWTAAVAALCPELRFMFPFPRADGFEATENCTFMPCSWESGLREEMEKSRFVVVPSLWSAPIEGSLVKSIVTAEAVVVVENATSFSDELPDGLCLKLPTDHDAAARALRAAYERGWRPDREVRLKWIADFSSLKQSFVPDLLAALYGNCRKPSIKCRTRGE